MGGWRAGAWMFACAGAAGCFTGEFLDRTCERQPEGCALTGTSGEDASTTGGPPPPDMGAPTSEGGSTTEDVDLPGFPVMGPSFRVDSFELVDPHVYYQELGCVDVHEVLSAEIDQAVSEYQTNVLLVARDWDPGAEVQTFAFYRDAICTAEADYCLLNPSVDPVVGGGTNKDTGVCNVAYDPGTLNPGNVDVLHAPEPPCVESPTASVSLEFVDGMMPVPLYFSRFVAQYDPGRDDPQGLIRGVLYGFIKADDARTLQYRFMGVEVALWSVIRGSADNACPVTPENPSDVDFANFGTLDAPIPVEGVWFYLNFTAKKVSVYAVN